MGRKTAAGQGDLARRDAGLNAQLSSLEQMGLDLLRVEWSRAYGAAPPPRLSRDLIARSIATKLQEAAYGGLPLAARRKLISLAAAPTAARDNRRSSRAVLRAGAMLVRTWRGQTHTVQVLRDGFEHQGQRYRSLSQIAEAITSTHWSGPRFFGLAAPSDQGPGDAQAG